ncbi:MAG: hypothetical protein WDA07_15480 [Leucobacter sp.]
MTKGESQIPEDLEMRELAEGLVPLVRNYINNEWDWRTGMTVPPEAPEGKYGPSAYPPGHLSERSWSIIYEGAYPWAVHFVQDGIDHGPIKEYLEKYDLGTECWNGSAIIVFRES